MTVTTFRRGWVTATGLVLGFAADRVLGDPRRFHPVAGFGQLAGRLEQRTYADSRQAGTVHVAVLVGGTAIAARCTQRVAGRAWPIELALTAVATWAVLGGRSLQREAQALSRQLADDDLTAARHQIRNLVGRDPSDLDADQLARACVESVAENTSDAVVAPLLWGAVAGVPGLLAYRAVNTLDAMIGHRSPRYLHFGWAAARLDDVANWVPARVAGVTAVLVAPLVEGSSTAAARAVRRDAGQHPSPNAGVVEAAFAGALGVQLGGVNVYSGEVEDRGTLGDGHPVAPSDIVRADRLATLVGVGALVVSAAVALALGRRR